MNNNSNFLALRLFCCPGPTSIEKFEYEFLRNNEDGEEPSATTEGDEPRTPAENEDTNVKKKLRALPYFLNPFVQANAGIFLSYFNVGIAIYLLSSPISYYLISVLGISSTQYSAYSTVILLPWSFKFLYGLLSDTTPIFKYRRKSWLIIGWTIFIVCNFTLASFDKPSFVLVSVMIFFMTCGYLQADVMNDTMAVERARHEYEEIKGALQTAAYTIRSYGSVIGAVLASILYNTASWGWGLTISQLFFLSGLIPLVNITPSLWQLEEFSSRKPRPAFNEVVSDVWNTLQLNAVWYPMIFIYSYSLLQVPNPAWTNFLVDGLGFTDFELGIITVMSAVTTWLGMLCFKVFLFDASWRYVYIFTTLVNFVFSLGQIVLVLGWNKDLGIPNLALALGDQAILYFNMSIQFMPTAIMFVMLCPEGSEGVTFALLTTISNLAYAVSYDISTGLSYIWNTDEDTLQEGDYSGVFNLTILTSLLQLLPICLVWILPDTRAEQREWRDSGRKNFWGGSILLSVVAFSLVFTIVFNFTIIFT